MRFLRLLFWSFVALLVLLFLGRNWSDVTVDLWGNLKADVKLPLLLVIAFLLGWLPTSVAWRVRHVRMKRSVALANDAPAAHSPSSSFVDEPAPASFASEPRPPSASFASEPRR